MAEDRFAREVYIVKPKRRAIIPLRPFRMPKKLAKTVLRDPFNIRVNYDFDHVIRSCATRQPTWINQQIIDAYNALHKLGYAHSIECWEEERLVGGLYGVALGGAFFGESMFSKKRDASKVALVHLVACLQAGNFILLDTQFITNHLRQFGAIEISLPRFMEKLNMALHIKANFHHLPNQLSAQLSGLRSLQEIGQIS